ncbi:RDD family protein [uncultured Anaerococcus sp.]|uniref:RDD family protein n=1 Tax=uncultured Anaerococcus sp. TaxID=293428 RepID=UPI0025D58223|nr:RDD family protein [uncultured Anaerococcus sp.]
MENRKQVINTKNFKERDYKHAYASYGIRVLAFIIDMAVVGAINTIIKNLGLIDPDLRFFNLAMTDIVKTLVTILYFTLLGLITRGQSLGKLITGIKVISLISDDLTASQIIIRETAGRFVQNKLFIIYLLPLFTPKNQGLIDFFVDTAVVKENALRDLYGKQF